MKKIAILIMIIMLLAQAEGLCLKPIASANVAAVFIEKNIFSREFTPKFTLHNRPCANIRFLCWLLKNRCGIDLTFRLPAVDIIDSRGMQLKKPAIKLAWHEITNIMHLAQLSYSKSFSVITNGSDLKPEIANKVFDMLGEFFYDSNIGRYHPPTYFSLSALKLGKEDFLASFKSGSAVSPAFVQEGEFFLKYITAVEELAKRIEQSGSSLIEAVAPEKMLGFPAVMQAA